jgi:thioredoxin-like negative regulator of GroEL
VLVFYRYASRWSSPEQLEQWMKRHASRRSRDYRVWMELLHGWKQDERAWQTYSGVMPEPPFGEATKSAKREVLENRYRLAPENAAHALGYAQALDADGDKAGAEKSYSAWQNAQMHRRGSSAKPHISSPQRKISPPPWRQRCGKSNASKGSEPEVEGGTSLRPSAHEQSH